MMRVALISVDSKMPNLALMKLSTYHKECGDEVKLYEPLFDRPQLCYVSKIFTFTPEPQFLPDCEIIKGGTGYDLKAKLPEQAEGLMPDYDLFGCEYALGRFSRGCPNNCPWCVVPKMDGHEVRKVANLSDFWCGQKEVRLLDDNLMANEDLFMDACEQLHAAGVATKWEALDIRLITADTARALASVKHTGYIHFAWDSPAQEKAVPEGVRYLKEAGIRPAKLIFYVLVGFNTSHEYDLKRIYALRDLGVWPFVMPFDKTDRRQKDLARWCNNRFVFARCPRFEDYDCPTNRAKG